MTYDKKGFYYYFTRFISIFCLPAAIAGLVALKGQYIDGTLVSDYTTTIKSLFLVVVEAYFISEVFRHGSGYTMVSTTNYKLFRCRESGKEETFMMFADNEEELERFFEYTKPHKIVFIEEAEMEGKSIEMKIFNQEYEDRQNNAGIIK